MVASILKLSQTYAHSEKPVDLLNTMNGVPSFGALSIVLHSLTFFSSPLLVLSLRGGWRKPEESNPTPCGARAGFQDQLPTTQRRLPIAKFYCNRRLTATSHRDYKGKSVSLSPDTSSKEAP